MSGIENQVNVNHTNTNEKVSLLRTTVGMTAGSVAGCAFLIGTQLLNDQLYKKFLAEDDKFTHQDKENFIDEANKMVEKSGITQRGFKQIVLIDPNKGGKFWDFYYEGAKAFKREKSSSAGRLAKGISCEEAFEQMKSDTKKLYSEAPLIDRLTIMFLKATKPLRKFSQWLYGMYSDGNVAAHTLKTGAFNSLTNTIYSGRPSSLLHEVGHAINKNGNQLVKMPFRLSFLSSCLLIPLVVINAMFTKKPAIPKENDKNQNNNDSSFKKIRNFAHKHVGLTVACLLIPMLAEEAVASFRAVKFVNASKSLGDNVKKQHSKALKLAFLTYLMLTVSISGAIKVSVLVKDKILAYKKKKNI